MSSTRLFFGLRTRRDSFAFLLALCAVLIQPLELHADSLGPAPLHIESVLEDEEGGKLSFPFAVFSERTLNELYVIDSRARVLIYTGDFYPLFTLDSTYGIEAPLSLTIDSEGNLYVVQAPSKSNPRNRISVLDASLSWKKDIYLSDAKGAGELIPIRIVVDAQNRIYTTLADGGGVAVLNREGRLLDMLTQEEDGKKVNISNVTIDLTGRLYLISEEMSRIYVYDGQGKFLLKFGKKGGTTGTLSRAQAVAVDTKKGNIYVADYMRHTICTYDQNGDFVSEFGGMGWSPGWLQFPRDITVDTSGRLLVADTFNHRVEVFQP